MNDSLGNRMKEYEGVPANVLIRKLPVIIRLDGQAFHTFTRTMDKPYDVGFSEVMWTTAVRLCEKVQGCQLAYVQSDEISLLLVDYKKIQSDPWFGYKVQKVVSSAAAIATAAFIRAYDSDREEVYGRETAGARFEVQPTFDSRCYNLPKEEVSNYFIWRQRDSERNSIQGLAPAQFSHKDLQNLNNSQLQEKLFSERGINWDKLPTPQKRGVCVIRAGEEGLPNWFVDQNIPIFTWDCEYIKRLVDVGN